MAAVRNETPYLIAFLTLNGFSAQSARVSDTALADTLDEYFALATDAIENGGGRIVKYIGDGILSVFSPQNADPGVLGLLALKPVADEFFQRRRWDCRLIVRVHFGTVVAGPLGSGANQRFDVLGRAVNIAARLESTGVALSVEAFRQLGPDVRQRFKKHTPPITYIRIDEPHRSGVR